MCLWLVRLGVNQTFDFVLQHLLGYLSNLNDVLCNKLCPKTLYGPFGLRGREGE